MSFRIEIFLLFATNRDKSFCMRKCLEIMLTTRRVQKINQTGRRNFQDTRSNSKVSSDIHSRIKRAHYLDRPTSDPKRNIGGNGVRNAFTYFDQVRRSGQWRRRRDASIPA